MYKGLGKALILALMVVFLAFSYGCRTKSRITINYMENGRIASQVYESESGFHFFSDGTGKVISPELNINGLNF